MKVFAPSPPPLLLFWYWRGWVYIGDSYCPFCFVLFFALFFKSWSQRFKTFFKFAHKIVCNLCSCMLNWPLALFAASLDILTWWECSRTLPWIQRSSSRSWSCVMSLARPGFFWFVSQSIPPPDFLLVSTFLFSFLSICSFSTSLTGFLCLPAPFFFDAVIYEVVCWCV